MFSVAAPGCKKVVVRGLLELDLGLGEVARAHALLEEHVELRVRAALGLRQTEVRVDEGDDGAAREPESLRGEISPR